ncbi:mitochondrial fission ELM1 family protein [Sphingomonas sp. SM33]|uniref:Mitochondrial fission ELM1 family protein n=1 Tax=Sphingomonas telluris TaxID=2907998 RepID=A0ABS9VKT4_9SPHN|nr:ELM1/GtrOC1 family putative glycosyltransferase [Sphingomonas telluris]MCH8615581.1 mitochondrial fission ELM1 family protein [Sphingomonas telluris]
MPRIWVLLGQRRGDNNQLLALAEALKTPFETRTLKYRLSWGLLLRLFPQRPTLVTSESRGHLRPPWPDVVIGIGRRSVAVARWIKRMSGGRTKLVRVGNPRTSSGLFDLVITTPQYPVPPAPSVLKLPLSMDRHSSPPKLTDSERAWLEELPRPHLLVSVGGRTRYWHLPEAQIVGAVERLAQRATASGGSLIVASSPRTTTEITAAIQRALANRPDCKLISDESLRYPVLLDDADEHFVTGDSVSMISEAIVTGKPVGLIPVELDAEGRKALGSEGLSSSVRDVRRVWAELQTNGLLGTIDEPIAGKIADPVRTAAEAVGALLD